MPLGVKAWYYPSFVNIRGSIMFCWNGWLLATTRIYYSWIKYYNISVQTPLKWSHLWENSSRHYYLRETLPALPQMRVCELCVPSHNWNYRILKLHVQFVHLPDTDYSFQIIGPASVLHCVCQLGSSADIWSPLPWHCSLISLHVSQVTLSCGYQQFYIILATKKPMVEMNGFTAQWPFKMSFY